MDKADDLGQRVIVAQLEVFAARDVVRFADGGKDLGLLDRVDAQVGLHVQLDVEHVGRVAGLFADDGQDLRGDSVLSCSRRRLCGHGRSRQRRRSVLHWLWRCCWRGCCREVRPRLVDKADDLGQRVIVAQLEVVAARDVVRLADGGKDLGLLDRVDAQVGLHVQLDVEHVGRVAGLFADDGQNLLSDGILALCGLRGLQGSKSRGRRWRRLGRVGRAWRRSGSQSGRRLCDGRRRAARALAQVWALGRAWGSV